MSEIMFSKPAPRNDTIAPSEITAGSVYPSFCNVTNCIGVYLSLTPMNALELFSLKNRVAVVLGGTSGIGQAIARGFAQAGAITIASSRDQDRGNAVADEFESTGTRTVRVTGGVQGRGRVRRAFEGTGVGGG